MRMRDVEETVGNTNANRGPTHTHTYTLPGVAKATCPPPPPCIRQGKSEIRTTAVSLHLSSPSSQPVAQIQLHSPCVSRGGWNLKWRFNEISGIVLWLDHSDPPPLLAGAGTPFLSSVRERGSTVANCRASGPRWGDGKRKMRSKTPKRDGSTRFKRSCGTQIIILLCSKMHQDK